MKLLARLSSSIELLIFFVFEEQPSISCLEATDILQAVDFVIKPPTPNLTARSVYVWSSAK